MVITVLIGLISVLLDYYTIYETISDYYTPSSIIHSAPSHYNLCNTLLCLMVSSNRKIFWFRQPSVMIQENSLTIKKMCTLAHVKPHTYTANIPAILNSILILSRSFMSSCNCLWSLLNTVLGYNHMAKVYDMMLFVNTLLFYKLFGFIVTDSVNVTDFMMEPYSIKLVSTF